MSNLFWLTEAQMAWLGPFFPKSHGATRVDDRRVLSGIIFINRNALAIGRCADAPMRRCAEEVWPAEHAIQPLEAVGDIGVFARIMEGLASEAAVPKTVMIDAT